MRPRFATLIAVAVLLAGFGAGEGRRLSPATAHAQVAAYAGFVPQSGRATSARLFRFSGFGAGEVLDLTFQAPDGTIAQVGNDTVFLASSEDDGTGQFSFQPSSWLQPLQSGTWQVTVTGESSGISGTVLLVIEGDDGG